MQTDPTIIGLLSKVDNRINSFDGNPDDSKRFQAQITSIKNDIDDKLKRWMSEQDSYWKNVTSKINSLEREIDSKNNQAA